MNEHRYQIGERVRVEYQHVFRGRTLQPGGPLAVGTTGVITKLSERGDFDTPHVVIHDNWIDQKCLVTLDEPSAAEIEATLASITGGYAVQLPERLPPVDGNGTPIARIIREAADSIGANNLGWADLLNALADYAEKH